MPLFSLCFQNTVLWECLRMSELIALSFAQCTMDVVHLHFQNTPQIITHLPLAAEQGGTSARLRDFAATR